MNHTIFIVIHCEGRVTASYDDESHDFSLMRPDFPHRTVHGNIKIITY